MKKAFSAKNEVVTDIIRSAFIQNDVNYLHLYREPLKRDGKSNIAGRKIKFWGVMGKLKNVNKAIEHANKRLEMYNVTATLFTKNYVSSLFVENK